MTTPPTAHVAFEELARRLEALGRDATWLPPSEVARLVREFAEKLPPDPEPGEFRPEPGGIVTLPGDVDFVPIADWHRAVAEVQRLAAELAEARGHLELCDSELAAANEQRDQARREADAFRAELVRVRDAPLARRHADGSLTIEWAEGQTSCLMAREVLDGILDERTRLTRALDTFAADAVARRTPPVAYVWTDPATGARTSFDPREITIVRPE